MIRFSPINIKAKSYPKPSVPILPVFSSSSLALKKNNPSSVSSFFQHGIFYSDARSALANALILSGVNKDRSVLMPAYHCGSMIEPALWLKVDVLLYQLNKDLSPKTSHIEQLISQSKKTVKVMLLPHYFGFLQDTGKWRKFCDHNNIILIEDCAHAFFGQLPNTTHVGSAGDFAIASVRKFFCAPNGGILIGKNVKPHTFPLQKPRITTQLHGMLSFIQQSIYYDRLGKLGTFITQLGRWRSTFKSLLAHITASAPEIKEELSPNPWKWFAPGLINMCGFTSSQWLMSHSNLERIIVNRRKNFLVLLEGIRTIDHLEPLFQTLPDNIIPYMLPVLLKSGEADFDRLMRSGIPIWRWEELAESDCTISQSYRLQLLHLPCHQELKLSEINWMLNTLEKTLGKKL